METATKQCRKCGERKPAAEFYRGRNRDGLSSWCRSCSITSAAEHKRRARAEGRYREQEAAYKAARYKRLWETDPAFKAKEYERKRLWAKNNPERARAYFLDRKHRRLYGMTTTEIRAAVETQGGKCAACNRSFGLDQNDMPHVDHDHSTGRVRAVLCGGCNKAAGMLSDDWQRVELLAAYLKRHSEEDMV